MFRLLPAFLQKGDMRAGRLARVTQVEFSLVAPLNQSPGR